MQNLKCIVAATSRAVSRAALIARQQGAEPHLSHVVSPLALYPGRDIDPVMNDTTRLAAARNPHDAAARDLHARFGIRAQVVQRISRPYSQIAEYASAGAADLVDAGALVMLEFGQSGVPILDEGGAPVSFVSRVFRTVSWISLLLLVIYLLNLWFLYLHG